MPPKEAGKTGAGTGSEQVYADTIDGYVRYLEVLTEVLQGANIDWGVQPPIGITRWCVPSDEATDVCKMLSRLQGFLQELRGRYA